MSVSGDLVWMLVKDNTSFMVKRDGVQLTAEPGNVMNKNAYKYSGLANSKTVSLRLNKDKKIELALKRNRVHFRNKPKGLFARQLLTKHMSNKKCKGAAAIAKATEGSFYRADLSKAAIARYHKLKKATGPVKPRRQRQRHKPTTAQ